LKPSGFIKAGVRMKLVNCMFYGHWQKIVLMLELNAAVHVGRPKRKEVQSLCTSNSEDIQEVLCPPSA
jgi:hypothetical protein